MTFPTLNCLPAGETLEALNAAEHFQSIDVRFCKEAAARGPDTEIETCQPEDASMVTIYGVNDFGQAVAIHDAELTPAGSAEIGLIAAKLVEIIASQKPGAVQ